MTPMNANNPIYDLDLNKFIIEYICTGKFSPSLPKLTAPSISLSDLPESYIALQLRSYDPVNAINPDSRNKHSKSEYNKAVKDLIHDIRKSKKLPIVITSSYPEMNIGSTSDIYNLDKLPLGQIICPYKRYRMLCRPSGFSMIAAVPEVSKYICLGL